MTTYRKMLLGAIAVLTAAFLIGAPSGATATSTEAATVGTPTVASGGYVTVTQTRVAFRGAWNKASWSEKDNMCSMWKISKKMTLNYAAQYLSREGYYPKRNIKKGTRKELRSKCRYW